MSVRMIGVLLLGWVLGMVCVVGLNSPLQAQRQGPKPPFANPIRQRAEMISLLKEIRDLLREQNALLRSGKIRVVSQSGPSP